MLFRRRAARRAQALADAEARQQAERDAAFTRMLALAAVYHWRGEDRKPYLERLVRPAVPGVQGGRR